MSAPVYRLRGVSKAYGERCVLQVASLDIYRGEILAVVGPSGAGKSTLLRLLNFLEPPTEGSIRFLGQEIGPGGELPLGLRRQVTTVFQQPLLLNRSVLANVSFGLRLRGRRNATEKTWATLEKVGLAAVGEEPARTLSGGEAQRVALARAMILEPEVLLLDEPTANLDPYNIGIIEQIVRTLQGEQGTTIVLVTHNIFQARRLAQRVALMLEGKIVEVAGPETFFESPDDPRTATFVRGEMIY